MQSTLLSHLLQISVFQIMTQQWFKMDMSGPTRNSDLQDFRLARVHACLHQIKMLSHLPQKSVFQIMTHQTIQLSLLSQTLQNQNPNFWNLKTQCHQSFFHNTRFSTFLWGRYHDLAYSTQIIPISVLNNITVKKISMHSCHS